MKHELASIFTSQSWKVIRDAIVGPQQDAIENIKRGKFTDIEQATYNIFAIEQVKNRVRQVAAEHELPDPFKE